MGDFDWPNGELERDVGPLLDEPNVDDPLPNPPLPRPDGDEAGLLPKVLAPNGLSFFSDLFEPPKLSIEFLLPVDEDDPEEKGELFESDPADI